MGSAWIGTEQVSNQLQAIVDSNRLDERSNTAADILDLSEVGSFSITRRDEKSITRMGDVDRRELGKAWDMNLVNRLRLRLRSSKLGLAFRMLRGDFRGMPIPEDDTVDAVIETEKSLYARFQAAELKRRER